MSTTSLITGIYLLGISEYNAPQIAIIFVKEIFLDECNATIRSIKHAEEVS
jgi:hypothetical protein